MKHVLVVALPHCYQVVEGVLYFRDQTPRLLLNFISPCSLLRLLFKGGH